MLVKDIFIIMKIVTENKKVDLAFIDKLLGDLKLNWCVWRYAERDNGKLGKVPYAVVNNNFIKISSTDITQWGEFDQAAEWLDKYDASGIGVLIGCGDIDTYNSNLIALDLDNCLNNEGGFIDDLPQEIKVVYELLVSAGVYFEVSPSGNGLRALWHGSKPAGIGEKTQWGSVGCEIYDAATSGRYVTITGNRFKPDSSPAKLVSLGLETTADICQKLKLLSESRPRLISPDQDLDLVLDAVSDLDRKLEPMSAKDILGKLKMLRQGKIKKLIDGNLTAYSGDASAGDLALCRLAANYTNSSQVVLDVWQMSALSNRDKFKRRDYQTRTLIKAFEGVLDDCQRAVQPRQRKVAAQISEIGDKAGELAKALADGKAPNTLAAIVAVLRHDVRVNGLFAYDDFTHNVLKLKSLDVLGKISPKDSPPELGQAWSDADTAVLTIFLQDTWGSNAKSGLVDEAVNAASRYTRVNTVVDRLDSLRWDGVKRVDTWLVEYLNADTQADSPLYLSAIGRAWLISAVARAYNPGCKVDTALILNGPQGVRKSSALRALTSSIAPHTFRENLPAIGQSMDSERALKGAWVIEMSELDCFSRSSSESVKSFLSRQVDSYRDSYGRRFHDVRRTCVFAGTSNSDQWLNDVTGARRFLTCTINKQIDIAKLEADASQIFAEAVALYKAGELWYISDPKILKEAEKSQSKRILTDGWDDLLNEAVIAPLIDEARVKGFTCLDLFKKSALDMWLAVNPERDRALFSREATGFSRALKRSGFEKSPVRSGGKAWYLVGSNLKSKIMAEIKA